VDSFIEANDGYKVRRILAPNGCTLAAIQHCAEDGPNATLMAAAPDLLAALRDLIAFGDADDRHAERWDGVTDRARAAIAKAEGK
jgi:hypothetical protein